MADYNENQINSNETERIIAEKQRINNEDKRQTNETEREASEATRQTNETEREAREATRQSNETTRISEYNIFMAEVNNNEDERIANEEGRVEAENSRVEAENIRTEFYEGFSDRLDVVDSQLAQNEKNIDNAIYFVTPEMFGYVHGEDSTEALNEAISYCRTNGAKLICKDITLFSDIDFRRVKLEITGTLNLQSYICKLGNNSASPLAPTQEIYNVDQDTDNYQLFILGAKGQTITIGECPKIKFEMSDLATESSMAYSTFNIGCCSSILIGNKDGITEGTLWFNENTLNLKRCSGFYMTGSYNHNNNIINGGCFEGSACIELEKGTDNIFRDIRFEGSPTAIFHSGTSHNYIFNSWISSYRRTSVAITNYGKDNKVIYTKLEPRFINYSIDTQDYTDGHFTDVSYDEATDSLVIPSWKTYFKSPFMEFNPGATFNPRMLGSVMGRVVIRVFDENFIELTDIEANCAIVDGIGGIPPGVDKPGTTGWASYALELIEKPDERIKYIRYELYSASTLSFKKLSINITTGDLYYYL